VPNEYFTHKEEEFQNERLSMHSSQLKTVGNRELTWQLVQGNTCQAAFALGYGGHLQGRTPSPSMRTYLSQSECTMLEEKDDPGTAISPFQSAL